MATTMDKKKMMTAGELLACLREFPDDMPVLVEGYETGWDSIADIRAASVVRELDPDDWDGEYQLVERDQAGQAVALIVGRRGDRLRN